MPASLQLIVKGKPERERCGWCKRLVPVKSVYQLSSMRACSPCIETGDVYIPPAKEARQA